MLILCSANETIAEAKILDYKELEFKDMQLRISETIFQKLCYLLKNLVENKRKNIMKQQIWSAKNDSKKSVPKYMF